MSGAQLHLEPAPRSAPTARHWLTDALGPESRYDVDVARLLLSELVTNAVLHARTAITVRVVETALSLRVEVTDVALPQDVGVPAPRDSDERDESGRGLQIVAMLASRWGFDGSDGGATVWFELLPAARATRTPASMSA